MHGFYGLHLNRIIGIQGINYIYLNSRSLLVEGPHQKRTLAVAKYAKLCWRVYRYLPSNNRKQLDVLHLENIQCSPLVAGNILIQRYTTVWLFVSLFLLFPSTVFPLLRFLIVFFKYTSVQQKQDHFIHPPPFFPWSQALKKSPSRNCWWNKSLLKPCFFPNYRLFNGLGPPENVLVFFPNSGTSKFQLFFSFLNIQSEACDLPNQKKMKKKRWKHL